MPCRANSRRAASEQPAHRDARRWPFLSRYVGKLPGDIVIRRRGFTFAFPIVTCLLPALVLTLLLWIFRR